MPGLPKIIIFAFLFYIFHASGLRGFLSRLLQDIKRNLADEPPQSQSRQDAEICYRLLGVSPSASWKEVEKAYKAKAKVHHPDLGGDEDAMRALNEAYQYIKKHRKG